MKRRPRLVLANPLLLFAPAPSGSPLAPNSSPTASPSLLRLPPSPPPPGSHPRSGSGASWSAGTAARAQLRGAGRVSRAFSGCRRSPGAVGAGPTWDRTGAPSPETRPFLRGSPIPRRAASLPGSLPPLGATGSREPPGAGHLCPQPGGESREPRAFPLRGLGLQVANFSNSGGQRGRGPEAPASWNQVGEAEGGGRLRAGGEGGPCASSPSALLLSRRPPAPGTGCPGPSRGRVQCVGAAALMGTRGPGLEEGTDE